MDEKRKGRLCRLFRQVLNGQDDIQTASKAKLFLEAICSQNDHAMCIESVLGSKNGIIAVKQSIRIDVTVAFMNSSIADFLQYLQNPDVVAVCSGNVLNGVLQHMTDPSTFWNYFCSHAKAGTLESTALQSFAWMLLRLLSIPELDATPFVAAATDEKIQLVLSTANQAEIRNLLHKIQHTICNLKISSFNAAEGPGGRHDNDFADFRKVALVPSIDELISSDAPYLRFASEIEAVDDQYALGAHLDNQFRLLREDMIRDMKEELTGQSKRKNHKIEGLELVGVDFDSQNPWALEFACRKGLAMISKHADVSSRLDFLKKHKKVLPHGALVSIFADASVVGFGTIWRREDKLSENLPLLHVRLPSSETIVRRTLRGIRYSSQISILHLHTALFAYEPILQQLQNVRHLPLAETMMSWRPAQSIPEVMPSPKIRHMLLRLKCKPSSQLQDFLSLPKPVCLDQSQASSLIVGLSQQIAVIQGPPGTGKSFIGALVAKALHEHTNQKILVLSYTNHALDQYLEDLINIGIPTSDIVRLGSPLKASNATKPLVLTEKSRSVAYRYTRGDWTLIKSSEEHAGDIGRKLVSTFAEYTERSAKVQDIMEYLEFSNEFQDFFDAFQLPHDLSFTFVDNKGRAAGPYYLLNRWMRNEKVNKAFQTSNHPRVWTIPPDTRDMLRKRWLDDILGERLKQVLDYGQQYDSQVLTISKARGENKRRLMKDMRIIGCTTTAAAKAVTDIQSIQPEIVIVEEAGEILESHILAALGPETKHLVLIGDHKQLRPKCHYDLSVEKGTGYDLNRSLFERLVLKGYPHQKLFQQHRMRPEISDLVRGLTYPELTDAPSTQGRLSVRGLQDNVVFIDHARLETEGSQVYDPRDGGTTSSKTNSFEAQMTLKIVKYMAQQGYRSDQIVVLTPYLGQLRLLFDVLQEENDPVLNDLDSYDLVKAGLMPAATAKASRASLRISTIDNYQGEESDIVIVSLTRSNKRGDIGFLSAPERLNVLISRARDGIILIGNTKTFLEPRNDKTLWAEFFRMLRDKHHIYNGLPVRCERHPVKMSELTTPEDFDTTCPDGGCDAPCGTILSCGVHHCPSKCHQLSDHTKMRCTMIVTDVCTNGHKLSWRCSDKRAAVCRTCETKKKRDEEQKTKEHERLLAEALRKQEHDAKIAEIDTQIELERRFAKDLRLQEEQERVLQQKAADLQTARESAKNFRKTQKPPQAMSVNHHDSGEKATARDQRDTINTAKQHHGSTTLPTVSPAAQDWSSIKNFDQTASDSIDKLMDMTGLESVKVWALQIFQRLQTARRQGIDVGQERFGLVMLGNPGTGKTTVARILAAFFAEMDIVSNAKFVETTGAKLANEGVAGTQKMLDDLLDAGGGIVFIDEAYQLVSDSTYTGKSVLDFLLAEIENTVGKIVFMFAGYEKQMEKFFQHNPGLGSRMPHRLKFADYTEKDLLYMLGAKIEKKFQHRMQVEDGISGRYMRVVTRRLHRLSGQEGFGNARALENVIARITSAQASRLSRERRLGLEPDDFYMCKEDIIGPEPSGALANSIAWQKLQSMVGLDSVKSSVKTLLDRLVENYRRELKELPILEASLNRLFLGSPGTGKTTVAKLYGQILVEIGMLSSSECVVKTPADFIGSVLGESEKNTKAILDDTKGKVLVLDEAYMLSPTSKTGDMYRTAVVDTIVSVVHNVPGDDRAVLLLGYEEQMKEMIREVNPGLARRFPLEDAFYFEDYNDQHLMEILNHKLVAQGLDATPEAKDAAINVLAKLRRRPNFGNAGEVENLLSRAKENYSRRPKIPMAGNGDDIVFQPQDFSPDFGRSCNAVQNCRQLFEDVVGSEDLVDKLSGYIQSFINAGEIGMDPATILPFNFVFKGPPGTGKTTTARKIGTIFYDMGFLGSNNVLECSATDLIGEYVGQTGPKVVSKFDEALGQVLFVDEAYRLAEGPFAKEAVDEIVDCLTKDRYKGKMLVVLAGYEDDINRLLKVNPGLSSRFPEEVMFHNLTPAQCVELLLGRLRKNDRLQLELNIASEHQTTVADLFKRLSQLSGWANGRDIETVASRTIAALLKTPTATRGLLRLTWSDILVQLMRMHTEREHRAVDLDSPLVKNLPRMLQQTDNRSRSPARPCHSAGIACTKAPAASVGAETVEEAEQTPSEDGETRDAGVSDAVWHRLQADKILRMQEEAAHDQAIRAAEAEQATWVQKASEGTARAEQLREQAATDDEARRAWEKIRMIAVEAKRRADEEADTINKLMEEKQQAAKKERETQAKLKQMGICPAGYRWIRQGEGYRCAGGGHFVTNAQLGI